MIYKNEEASDSIVKIAVLASGRGSNFEALCTGDTGRGRVALLLTDNTDAPVLDKALSMGVEALYISPGKYRTKFAAEGEEEWTRSMKNRGIELVCLAGLMRIIKGPMLDDYRGRIMNIHPSLLPSFPGLHAQKQALDYGVKVSGCTVHYVDRGIDTGPVILQKAVEVLDHDTEASLSGRILRQEHIAYSEAVKLHCGGRLDIRGRQVVKNGC
ncbi:MAG: phosphoribosylglycinamide formyltransferase [Candidatus Aegiribacteria sp.]|nr:phosphoribosylglycinamide formyltransferase [Candidatus Aegiribacteria sp.]MBD3294283.1 phosphoribosylglycinamide formyltransferase [Candidatus Fermentibacteria bacterium]